MIWKMLQRDGDGVLSAKALSVSRVLGFASFLALLLGWIDDVGRYATGVYLDLRKRNGHSAA